MKSSQIAQCSAATPYPNDWQKVCDNMQTLVEMFLDNNQDFHLDGYLSTMLSFVSGLGSSPDAKNLQKAMQAFHLSVGNALAGKTSTWKQDLKTLADLFPTKLSANCIGDGLKKALHSVSEIPIDPTSSPYAAGFQQSLLNLLSFATPRQNQLLTAYPFQDPLNAFIDNPDASQQKAFLAGIQTALQQL